MAGATSEAEFFDRLSAAGLLIRQRVAPSGDLLGHKVALPQDRDKDGEPIFYAGSILAPDLSLPRIRERWSDDPDHANLGQGSDTPTSQVPQPTGSARRSLRGCAPW